MLSIFILLDGDAIDGKSKDLIDQNCFYFNQTTNLNLYELHKLN